MIVFLVVSVLSPFFIIFSLSHVVSHIFASLELKRQQPHSPTRDFSFCEEGEREREARNRWTGVGQPAEDVRPERERGSRRWAHQMGDVNRSGYIIRLSLIFGDQTRNQDDITIHPWC